VRVLMDGGQAGNRSGTGRHVVELCAALGTLPEAGEWTVLCPPGFDPGRPFHVLSLPGNAPARYLAIRARLRAWCDARGVDAVYFPSSTAVSRAPRPMVVQVHDLCYLAHPEWFSPARRAWYRVSVERPARRADLVLVDSQSTADDVCRLLGIPETRVVVVHLGVSKRFSPLAPGEVEQVRKALGCPRGYFLFVGTIEPRKNLPRLARAWDRVAEETGLPLVVAGRRGWRHAAWDDTLRALEHRPLLTDHVTEDQLPKLMGAATVLVWPSLMEGFGLPPLEAMACGTPVITSNRSSLPEVCGDAAVLVNPEAEEELAEAMRAVAADEGWRNRLRAAGLRRAAAFTWDACARKTLDALSRLG